MLDFSMLPASNAEKISQLLEIDEKLSYTHTINLDEGKLYTDLSNRLAQLETSLVNNNEALLGIIQESKEFKLFVDDKEEILMRISWLQRLDKVQQELSAVQTKEQAQKLIKLMAVCQTSPLKSQLTVQLDEKIQSLPSKEKEVVQTTDAELLMNQLFEDAGHTFINLGKTGREFVIENVLTEVGMSANAEDVKKRAIALEEHVTSLADIKEATKLIRELKSLPIKSFSTLSTEKKTEIVGKLIETDKWNGLATLERIIRHWDRVLTSKEPRQQEPETTILTSGGKVAYTFDIRSVNEDGIVQLDSF